MKIRTKDIILIAFFSILTAVGAFIRVPVLYVPFTMQTFFVALSGILLGSKRGAMSQILYIIIGLSGIPIFTQGGGLTYIFKPTFGYLIGFIFGAYIIGFLSQRLKRVTKSGLFLSILPGLFVIYLIGLPWMYCINNYYIGNKLSVWMSLYYGFILCIGGDIISSWFAALLSIRMFPILNKIGFQTKTGNRNS